MRHTLHAIKPESDMISAPTGFMIDGTKFTRTWAMPNADTMEIVPIRHLVMRYTQPNTESVDLFARNCRIAKWRNDLNPDTLAEHHMHALDFLQMVQSKVAADLVLFDPPYSPFQTKMCYQGIGLDMKYGDDARHGWSKVRKSIASLVRVGGIVISFGWDTIGVGSTGFDIVEILCVCHGIGHNDTLCLVQRKVSEQTSFLGALGAVESGLTACNNRMAQGDKPTLPEEPATSPC